MKSPAISRRRRGWTKPPLQQGDLDGLCGVYSVINAIRYLVPELGIENEIDLFDALLQGISDTDVDFAEIAVWGTPRDTLIMLLELAVLHVRDSLGVHLSPACPTFKRERPRLPAIWKTLRHATRSEKVAIVGIEGVHSHWTVVVAAGDRTLRLFDSNNLRQLRRGDCGTGLRAKHLLNARDIILLGPHTNQK